MNKARFLLALLPAFVVYNVVAFPSFAQETVTTPDSKSTAETSLFLENEPSPKHPFGQMNRNAPSETAHYAFLIGEWACDEQRRRPGEPWQAFTSKMLATFFLNGYGIRNHTYMAHSTSSMMYEYDLGNGTWVITNTTAPEFNHSQWTGKKDGDKMVARRETTAPNGNPLTLQLTFFNISEDQYKWMLEAVTPQGNLALRTKTCTRVR